MAQEFVLGMNAVLLLGADEVGSAKDVTVTLEAGEADVTTRANDGWRATAATLRTCSIEFELIWKPGDAVSGAIKTAFLTSGQVELTALSAPLTEGGEGPKGKFSISTFSRKEPLEEGVAVSVTAKLAKFIEWVEGTVPSP